MMLFILDLLPLFVMLMWTLQTAQCLGYPNAFEPSNDLVGPLSGSNEEEFKPKTEDSVREKIFDDYAKEIRPSKTVIVDVLLHLITVNDLVGILLVEWTTDTPIVGGGLSRGSFTTIDSELEKQYWFPQSWLILFSNTNTKKQTFSTTGYFVMKWEDSRLVWNSTNYMGVDVLFSDETNVWTPPVIISNEVNKLTVISDEKVPVRINATGEVEWQPPILMETSCIMDVTFYPFDSQTCSIEMVTWGYFLDELSLKARSIDMLDFTENGEWNVVDFYLEREEGQKDGNDVSKLTFTFKLRRRPLYYVLTAIIPAILMSFLSPIVFILPPDAGEKVSYIITVFLAYAVLLTLITDQLPSAARTPSAISVYLTIVTVLGAFTVLVTIKILDIYHRNEMKAKSAWLEKLVSVAEFLTCQSKNKYPPRNVITPTLLSDGQETKVAPPSPVWSSSKRTWKEIALILDALWFNIIAALTIGLALVFVIALVSHYYTTDILKK